MTTTEPAEPVGADQVLSVLRDVVDDAGPDFQYRPPSSPACVYADAHGDPSCIVGRVLFRLGATAAEVAALDEGSVNNTITGHWLKGRLPVKLTSEAVSVLAVAQRVQDWGSTQPDGPEWQWGTVLKCAEKAHSLGLNDPRDATWQAVDIHGEVVADIHGGVTAYTHGGVTAQIGMISKPMI